MSSSLAPNTALLCHFQGFLDWAKVVEARDIERVRLDEVVEVADLDFLKIDVQGSEVAVFEGGREKLAKAMATQTEMSALSLYLGAAMFSAVDQRLRALSYRPHSFAAVNTPAVKSLVVRGSI
jgi:hypothetical protein